MAEPYGLPPGTAINYRALGFPPWVDELCRQWGLDSSTYPGHQESDRPDIGAAINVNHENRGIDWTGDPQRMLDFARWLADHGPDRHPGSYGPPGLEMVIYEHAPTGERVWYPVWVNYGGDFSGHRDHVHTRFSASVIDYVPPLSSMDRYALAIIDEGRKRGISRRGICIALSVPFVESGYKMYANSNVPESLNYPHEAVGSDHDSTGLFQQRQAWGPLSCTMDAACSAGLFYDGGRQFQRGLRDFDYDNEANTPGFYAQAVQVSAYPGRYDQHWGEAVALYDRLAGVTPDDWEELMANPELERMLRELHAVWVTDQLPSNSRYGDPSVTWTRAQYLHHIDGFLFDFVSEHNGALGDSHYLGLVQKAAGKGDVIAQNFLQQLSKPPAASTSTNVPAVVDTTVVDALRAENAQLRAEIARLETAGTAVVPVDNGQPAGNFGQVLGRLYSAIEELHLADALNIEERATLGATIKILETKNGTLS